MKHKCILQNGYYSSRYLLWYHNHITPKSKAFLYREARTIKENLS